MKSSLLILLFTVFSIQAQAEGSANLSDETILGFKKEAQIRGIEDDMLFYTRTIVATIKDALEGTEDIELLYKVFKTSSSNRKRIYQLSDKRVKDIARITYELEKLAEEKGIELNN